MEGGQKNVITGIIMPNNWDDAGRIIEIALYTDTEEIYAIKRNSLTGELMNHLHKRARIRGKIREHPDGNKSITAQNYSLLKDILGDK
jgi:hypothetical protein